MTELALGFLAAPREGGSGAIVLLIQMTAIFAIFYLLLIRPQKKEQERHRQMVDTLGKGAEIVTSGGIIGRVIEARPDQLVIESEGTRLAIERARVARVIGPKVEGEAAQPAQKKGGGSRR